MTIRLSTDVSNARLDAIETTVGVAPLLQVYSGTMPANCAAALAGNTLLAEMILPPEWMATAGNGAKAGVGAWRDMAALSSGTASFFRIYDTGGNECHVQGSISIVGGGGSMQFASTALLAGYPVVVARFVLRAGEAPPFVGSASLTLSELVSEAVAEAAALTEYSIEFGVVPGTDYVQRTDAPAGGVLFSAWFKLADPVVSWPAGTGNHAGFHLKFPNWFVRFITLSISGSGPSDVFFNANSMIFGDGTAHGENPETYAGDYSYLVEQVADDTVANGWVFMAWQTVNDGANITVRQWVKYTGFAAQGPYESIVSYGSLRTELVNGGWSAPNAAAWTPAVDASAFVINGLGGDDPHLDITHARMESNSGSPTLSYIESLAALSAADPTAWGDWKLDWSGGAPNLADRSGNGRGLSSPAGSFYQGSAFP